MAELFIELFSDEIPAKLQTDIRKKIKYKLEESLKKKEIDFRISQSFSTPTRLVFLLDGIPEKIKQKGKTIKGPNINAPEVALSGFVKSNNLSKSDIFKKKIERGEFYFAKTKRKLNNSIKIANTIGIVLIAISAMNIISDNIQGNYSIDFLGTSENIITTTIISDKPDVYYIILDAYAGDYALKNYFGYENNEFLSFLKENNFHVVPDAKPNYGTTFLSLASSLNIQHHNCLEDANFCVGTSKAFEMIQNNKVMKKFNEEGYTIVNSYSGWTPTRDFDIAYSNLCGRYSATINSELTITIIGKSMLNPIYVKLFEDVKRDQVLCVFSELEEVHHSYDKPIFVFSHMVLPHHPYVFGANGEDVSPETLEIGWQGLENDKEGYLNQLKFTNKKIQHFITKVIDESEIPPIIIIQGDHGLKSEMKDIQNPTDQELKERFSILNAYYIPTKNELLDQNITPVNSFRIIINELFNEQLEMLPNTNYWTVPDPPYIKEVTHILQGNNMN